MLTWLADRLRAAGLSVVEMPGWKTHCRPGPFDPTGLIFHATADAAHTGTGDTTDDASAIRVIRDGRSDLAGPIALAYVNRQGVWYVISAGRQNTVKTGWAGPLNGLGNTHVVGVEAENDNKGEPWPQVQLDSLRRGFAVILRGIGQPASRLAGHYEHQPHDKTDPYGIDMNTFRRQVADVMAGKDTDMISQQEWAASQNVDWATTNRTDAILANRPELHYTIGTQKRVEKNGLYAALLDLKTMLAKSAAREDAAIVAIKALATDPTAVVEAINRVADEVGELRAQVTAANDRADGLERELETAHARLSELADAGSGRPATLADLSEMADQHVQRDGTDRTATLADLSEMADQHVQRAGQQSDVQPS